MKFLIPVAFICLLASSCYSPERNCAKFKTGTYVTERYLNGELKKSRFIRNDSISIDVYENKRDTSSIRWINDCEYILRNINPQNHREKQAVHIKILTTQDDQYTFEFSLVGESSKHKLTAKKVD